MKRSLAAILAADVVGYSTMMNKDEASALAALKRLRDELFEPHVECEHGRVVKRLGDGWLVEFASAVDAVNCALAVQRGLNTIDDVHLRIGVHVGDIVREDDDIYGDGVNVAARLEAAGAAGHVLISEDVHRQIVGRIDTPFHDNGRVTLKNIGEPVRIWSWPQALPGLSQPTRAKRKPSIHVARFEARDPSSAELSEALTEDLATAFVRQSGVEFVSVADIADYVVAGTIRSAGNRWRISVSLTDTGSGQVAWSDRFDETGDDFFDIQDRCVTRISGAVRIRMPSLEARKLGERPIDDMSVEELLNYAMNRHFSPTTHSWGQAVPALELVLQREPGNWMAMTMLSFNVLAKARLFGWRPTEEDDAAKVRQLIQRAQNLKPSNEVVRMTHGCFLLYVMRDHRAARIEAEEALRLNPDFYHSINLMSQVETFCGDRDRALELALRGIDCDPAYPYLHIYQRGAGYVYAALGRYDEAVDCFDRADRAASGLPQNLIGIAACAQLAGSSDSARNAIASLMETAPDFNLREMAAWPFRDQADWQPFRDALAVCGAPAASSVHA